VETKLLGYSCPRADVFSNENSDRLYEDAHTYLKTKKSKPRSKTSIIRPTESAASRLRNSETPQ
jgi:hypothetical protein